MPSPYEDAAKDVQLFGKLLSKYSGYEVDVKLSKNFMYIIDGLKNNLIDVAFMNSSAYLLAKDWGCARAIFQLDGFGHAKGYQSAIVANVNSGINTIEDIAGKKIAYTDSYSMSGYLIALALLKEKNIEPAKSVFAGGYVEALEKVYSGEVDAAVVYYLPPDPYGRIHDARERIVEKYPDTLDKVKVVEVAKDVIPGTPIVLRSNLTEDMQKVLMDAMGKAAADQEGLLIMEHLYGASGVVVAREVSFIVIEDLLKKLGKNITEVVPGAVTFYKSHFWEHAPERQ
jgi:phosphonate transport system substrate-binding protein